MYNLNRPDHRAVAAAALGPARYSALVAEHQARQVVATVNGHRIMRGHSAIFGNIYYVEDHSQGDFELRDATLVALRLPPGPHAE